ncbi:MAG: acylphosphatase [Waddliaceae bacterium]
MDDESLNQVMEMHAIVHGRVQGVFFRATTRKYAEKLGLRGTVKNKTDGTVEIFAQGTKKELNTLVELLQSDSGPGYVDSIATEFRKPIRAFNDFSIV